MKRPTLSSPAAVAVATLLAAVALAPLGFAQQAAPATAATNAKSDPMLALIQEAETNFFAGKYADASKKYQEALNTYSGRMDESARGALTFRKAGSTFLMKDWAAAEAALKDFLEKFPNGTGDFLDPNNNMRGTARLSLAEAMVNQGKFDEALADLRAFTLGFDNKFEDKVKAQLFMADVMERKVAKGSEAEKKEALNAAVEIVKPVVQNNLAIPEVREAAYKLVALYTRAGLIREATQLRKELEAKITNPADLVRANFLKLDLGDRYFNQAEALQSGLSDEDVAKRKTLYKSAIAAYQGVHRRKYIEGFVAKALAQAEARVKQAKAQNPVPEGAQPPEPVVKAEAELAALQKNAEDLEKNKDYDSLLAYRLGLCLVEMNRPWEARVAFKDIVERNPEFDKADVAAYYNIICLNDVSRFKEAQDECRKFLEKYPQSAVVGNVAVMLGDISLRREDYKEAIANFRWARLNVKTLSAEDCEYIDAAIADSFFRNLDLPEARRAIENFVSNYPKSAQQQTMQYMRALTYFYEGKYKETIASFKAYSDKYPNGQYLPDIRYRYALVILGIPPENDTEARKNAQDVISRCDKWLADYADSVNPQTIAQRAEVINLKADAYLKISEIKSVSANRDEKAKYVNLALGQYIEAAKAAGDNKQVLDFALRELNKTLPARGEWDRLRSVYQGLYDRDPKSPEALSHLYWIIRCTEKLGKTPEEKIKSAEEAKGILAGAIVENFGDIRQENVENLIIELANKLAREARRAEKLNRDKPGSVEPVDPEKEIDRLLRLKDNTGSFIAQARGLFAKAQIALSLKDSAAAARNFDAIARRFQPGELSPTILAIVGDHLLAAGKLPEAESFYAYLKEHFRGSNFADFGFAGLADIRLRQRKPKEALELAADALESGVAFTRERDLRFLEARAKLESGDLDGAKKAFTEIAGVKEWRGETTAGSLYHLGLVEERKGNLKEAVLLYQRCALSWRRYENYAMKSILRAATLFADKLGQTQAARDTLDQNLFKNDNAKLVERYKTTPEWAEAEKLAERIR